VILVAEAHQLKEYQMSQSYFAEVLAFLQKNFFYVSKYLKAIMNHIMTFFLRVIYSYNVTDICVIPVY